jgi:hypothetical protein
MLGMSPQWVEAWSAVAAAVFTMGALVWQARAQRASRKAEETRAESKSRAAVLARARAVIVTTDEPGALMPRTRVCNYGAEPVIRLRAAVHLCGPYAEFRGTEHLVVGALAPLESCEVSLLPDHTGINGVTSAHVDIHFDDLHGNTWLRCGDAVTPAGRSVANRPDAR